MAGYTQGSVQELLTSAVTISANNEDLVKDDIDLTGCAYAWMMVDVTTSDSATDGVELRLYKKTGIGGTRADNPSYIISVDEAQTNYDAEMGTIEPGVYALYAKNNDGTYSATINQIRVNKFTYA